MDTEQSLTPPPSQNSGGIETSSYPSILPLLKEAYLNWNPNNSLIGTERFDKEGNGYLNPGRVAERLRRLIVSPPNENIPPETATEIRLAFLEIFGPQGKIRQVERYLPYILPRQIMSNPHCASKIYRALADSYLLAAEAGRRAHDALEKQEFGLFVDSPESRRRRTELLEMLKKQETDVYYCFAKYKMYESKAKELESLQEAQNPNKNS